jgi:nitroreductase
MYSQRQITRYKPDPVPREAIEKIIEAATKAPSGGNTQPWEFVVITDRDLISRIGQIYSELWLGARGAQPSSNESPVYRAARSLARHIPEVPAMILVCVDHSRGSASYTPGRPIERGLCFFHLAGGAESFPGGPRSGTGDPADYYPPESRSGNQRDSGNPRAGGDGMSHPSGLSKGPVRPYHPASGSGSYLL